MNRFFTILLIPEKSSQVKKIVLPASYLRISILLGLVGSFFLAFMIYDYVNVMQQIAENRKLQIENRQLKEKIQIFGNKLQTVESTLDRIQTFATKLRIITNQTNGNIDYLKKKVTPVIPGIPMDDHSETPESQNNFKKQNKKISFPFNSQKRQISQMYQPAIYRSSNTYGLQKISTTKTQIPQQLESYSSINDLLNETNDLEIDGDLDKEFENLDLSFQRLSERTKKIEINIQSLASTLLDQKDYLASMPTLKPTDGWYTSGFGMRLSPYTGKPAMHEGLDIANHYGRPIISPAAGIVSLAGVRPGYGNLITIDHGYGIQTQYGHVSKFYVAAGDRVKRGQKIGAVGSTGRSTGPHVHYEVRVYGIPVEPNYYILND